MKRIYIFFLIGFLLNISSIEAQCNDIKTEYEIINDLLIEYLNPSGHNANEIFLSRYQMPERKIKYFNYHYNEMLDSLNLREKFNLLDSSTIDDKLRNWNWKRNKIEHRIVKRKIKSSMLRKTEYFAFSHILFSNDKKLFFLFVKTSTGIFALAGTKEDLKINIIYDKTISHSSPMFR